MVILDPNYSSNELKTRIEPGFIYVEVIVDLA